MRSKTGYAEFGYFHCSLKMDAPRALVFRPLVKGNEALGTRLRLDWKLADATVTTWWKYVTSLVFRALNIKLFRELEVCEYHEQEPDV